MTLVVDFLLIESIFSLSYLFVEVKIKTKNMKSKGVRTAVVYLRSSDQDCIGCVLTQYSVSD